MAMLVECFGTQDRQTGVSPGAGARGLCGDEVWAPQGLTPQ